VLLFTFSLPSANICLYSKDNKHFKEGNLALVLLLESSFAIKAAVQNQIETMATVRAV
jgi:hypothetical protein